MVSPTSYCASVMIDIPAMISLAKSWRASPKIAVVIPSPAKIELILIELKTKIDHLKSEKDDDI